MVPRPGIDRAADFSSLSTTELSGTCEKRFNTVSLWVRIKRILPFQVNWFLSFSLYLTKRFKRLFVRPDVPHRRLRPSTDSDHFFLSRNFLSLASFMFNLFSLLRLVCFFCQTKRFFGLCRYCVLPRAGYKLKSKPISFFVQIQQLTFLHVIYLRNKGCGI